MSEGARSRLDQLRKRERFAAAAVAILFLSVFAGILLAVHIFVAPPDQTSFEGYVVREEEAPSYTKVQDISSKSSLPPVVPDIIISNSETSEMALNVEVAPLSFQTSSELVGGIGDGGLGDGIGAGSNKGGMGSRGKVPSAFAGRFWDLKKTPAGADSKFKDPMMNERVLKLISQFYNTGWNTGVFAPFCEAKDQLYADCFFMPNCMDHEATHAYDEKGTLRLKPSRWVAVYHARVLAPKSGKFRFWGAGDSVLAVRFNGSNVLCCGFHDLKTGTWNGLHVDTPGSLDGKSVVDYASCAFWNDQFGGFVAGDEFSVKEGEWYDMQVLVSEIGGGNFGFCLLIEDMSEEGRKRTKDKKPLYQLFRTSLTTPDAKETYESIRYKPGDESEMVYPPYDEDGWVWEAKPVERGNRSR